MTRISNWKNLLWFAIFSCQEYSWRYFAFTLYLQKCFANIKWDIRQNMYYVCLDLSVRWLNIILVVFIPTNRSLGINSHLHGGGDSAALVVLIERYFIIMAIFSIWRMDHGWLLTWSKIFFPIIFSASYNNFERS